MEVQLKKQQSHLVQSDLKQIYEGLQEYQEDLEVKVIIECNITWLVTFLQLLQQRLCVNDMPIDIDWVFLYTIANDVAANISFFKT